MGCMADYDEDCKGKKPKGCMCLKCCEDGEVDNISLKKCELRRP